MHVLWDSWRRPDRAEVDLLLRGWKLDMMEEASSVPNRSAERRTVVRCCQLEQKKLGLLARSTSTLVSSAHAHYITAPVYA